MTSLSGKQMLTEVKWNERWLDVAVYDENMKLDSYVTLCYLNGLEGTRMGGRFERYSPKRQEHVIRHIINLPLERDAPFGPILDWIANNVYSWWSFEVEAYAGTNYDVGEEWPDFHIVFSFSDIEDAFMFKLSR